MRTLSLLLVSLCLWAAPAAAGEDPHLWLEEIESPQALDWARERNRKALAALTGDPLHRRLRSELRRILLAQDRLPHPGWRGGWVYNFWQDSKQVRGLWRRARLDEYAKPRPRWEALLDLDALSRREKENWVWKGANCLPPEYERCLLSLSRGGKDAVVVREFDVRAKRFVAGGFELPEAKSGVAWIDADTVLVGTDFGEGSLTRSGYPRTARLWRRGAALADAPEVFAGRETDVGVWGSLAARPEGSVNLITRSMTFFTAEHYALEGGAARRLPLPEHARLQTVFEGLALAVLREDWKLGRRLLPRGALVGVPLDAAERDLERRVELVYAPDERSALRGVSASADALYLSVLENVSGRVLEARRGGSGWDLRALPLPDKGSAGTLSVDPFSRAVLLAYESFLVPDGVYAYEPGAGESALRPLRRLPERFRAEGMAVEQFEARSRDGTAVPYFIVRPKNAPLDGSLPVLLYGYGGFESALSPWYLETAGKLWLERGGGYAVANIRGGGEFGPRWHQAALKENRQKAFDDFAAVASDLAARGLTSPARLGIMGGSNGGLLMGASLTQRPELFGAVVIQVPLLDMLRYHKLLAGASWMGEYGDPDDPREGAALRAYSPYHRASAGVRYPPVFLITSTKDDRVHPGHARKMAARLSELGHDALYFENIEGGHSAAANLEQRVLRQSLEYSFLIRRLMGGAQ